MAGYPEDNYPTDSIHATMNDLEVIASLTDSALGSAKTKNVTAYEYGYTDFGLDARVLFTDFEERSNQITRAGVRIGFYDTGNDEEPFLEYAYNESDVLVQYPASTKPHIQISAGRAECLIDGVIERYEASISTGERAVFMQLKKLVYELQGKHLDIQGAERISLSSVIKGIARTRREATARTTRERKATVAGDITLLLASRENPNAPKLADFKAGKNTRWQVQFEKPSSDEGQRLIIYPDGSIDYNTYGTFASGRLLEPIPFPRPKKLMPKGVGDMIINHLMEVSIISANL